MNIDIQELLNAKKEKLREQDQKLKDLEEATKRLKLREMLKKREIEQAVLSAKNKAKREVIDAVKAKIPASAPSYFKPSARAVLRDLHKVIAEEEEEIKKSAKRT